MSNTLGVRQDALLGGPPLASARRAWEAPEWPPTSGRRETPPSPPPGAFGMVHAECGHAPEVVRGTEQRKIIRHTGATAYAGSPTAVPALHQLGNLSLDLGGGSSDSALSTRDAAVGFLIAGALPPGDVRESCDRLPIGALTT